MIKLSFDDTIHFVGIGGIGMSGIAEVMTNLGYNIQGSDLSDGQNIERLKKIGIKIFLGHNKKNISGVKLVVCSSAISNDNPEINLARELNIPILKRAEMLAELIKNKKTIAVGGTHGKTTTTSLVSEILFGAGFDPTIFNGGIINCFGTNARLGESDWAIVEADESDGTFLELPVNIAVVTNIDREHLDFYGDFSKLKKSFIHFINNVPDNGLSVICNDDKEINNLLSDFNQEKIITYGITSKSNFMAKNIYTTNNFTSFDVYEEEKLIIRDIKLPMIGHHNVLNALAAITVSKKLNVDEKKIKDLLLNFTGVSRRFSKVGVVNDITIFDDYGHHPVEIRAVLDAARDSSAGKIIAVMQPHRYSRLSSLFNEFSKCFDSADHIIISNVYSAGEEPDEHYNRDSLIDSIKSEGKENVLSLENPEELPGIIKDIANKGDWVICLGAGDITNWARELPQGLKLLLDNKGVSL